MKVLIVEDDEAIRKVLKSLVECLNHHTAETAADVDEAERIFAKQKPDAVILDYWMDGRASTSEEFLTKHQKQSKFIVMSADTKIGDVAKKFSVEFASKPFDIETIHKFLNLP